MHASYSEYLAWKPCECNFNAHTLPHTYVHVHLLTYFVISPLISLRPVHQSENKAVYLIRPLICGVLILVFGAGYSSSRPGIGEAARSGHSESILSI